MRKIVFVAAIAMLGAAPAARITDATTRGTILAPGAPMVMICGLPAARVGDAANSLVQVGAARLPTTVTIVSGSASVLIGGMKAARIGDVTSNGDKILVGCPTVLIGP
jgi:uncharacterized Zn-binding protein involved in type VI secretion